MKKVSISLLCLLLVGLGACKTVDPSEETTVSTSARTTVDTTVASTASQTSKNSTPTVEIKTSRDDPYSFIVKGHYDAMNSDPDVSTYNYCLYDLDGDGKNELLDGLEDWGLYDVYTIQNGVAVRQMFSIDPALNSPPILYENGTIRRDTMRYEDDGIAYIGYFRLESGELKQTSLTYHMYDDEIYARFDPVAEKDIPITKEEFDRVKKEFEGDGQVVELDWKPLAEYGR